MIQIRDGSGQLTGSVKWIAGAIASLTAILGAAFTIDARYAHAGDMNAAVGQVRQETRYAVDVLRKQNLEDKIFELTLIPENRRSDAQRAMLERYRTQAREVDQRWTQPPPTTLADPR